jgi:hypothetical protein
MAQLSAEALIADSCRNNPHDKNTAGFMQGLMRRLVGRHSSLMRTDEMFYDQVEWSLGEDP